MNKDSTVSAIKQAVVEVDLDSEAEKKKKRAERFGIPASLEVSIRRTDCYYCIPDEDCAASCLMSACHDNCCGGLLMVAAFHIAGEDG